MVILRRFAMTVMVSCVIFALTLHANPSAAQEGGTRAPITAGSVGDLTLLAEVQPHHREEWSVAISPDGSLLATGDYAGRLRLWDVSTPDTPQMLIEWQAHDREIYALEFSPEGDLLASAGWDGMVRFWDVTTADTPINAMRFRHGEPVYGLAFAPRGRYFVSGGGYSANELRFWNLDERRMQSTPGDHYGWINDVTFSPNGMFLVSVSGDGAWRQWDMSIGKPYTVVRGHQGPVGGVAFSPDSAVMATSSLDGTIKLWDPVTDDLLNTIDVGSFVWRIAYSPDGSLIVGDGRDGSLLFWDAASGDLVTTLQAHRNWVNDFAYSPDGSLIASVGEDGMIRLWAVE